MYKKPTPNKLDEKRKSFHHIITKTLNAQNNESVLKAVRKMSINIKGSPLRITPDFTTKTLKARRAWTEVM